MGIHINTVSRETATKTMKNWHEYAIKKLNFDLKAVPKAIYIPIVDLKQLFADFKKYGGKRELSGIRIYLTKKYSIRENPDDIYLTCIVVPTVKKRKGKPSDKDDNLDAIIRVPNSVPGSKKGSKVSSSLSADSEYVDSIYDMTHPCPPLCNGTTPVPW